MNQKQAELLYREMFYGEIVGVDSRDEPVMKDSPLAAILHFNAAPVLGVYHKKDEAFIANDRAKAAAFLRQWADALDPTGTQESKNSIPDDATCLFKDGTDWCCVRGDFIDLQVSPAAFGKSPDEAVKNLRDQDVASLQS